MEIGGGGCSGGWVIVYVVWFWWWCWVDWVVIDVGVVYGGEKYFVEVGVVC